MIPKAIPRELAVYNTNTTTPNNGGRCCLWTVPSVLRMQCLKFGAVASGDGGCCCLNGISQLVDPMVPKALDVEAGQQITICAAGPNVL